MKHVSGTNQLGKGYFLKVKTKHETCNEPPRYIQKHETRDKSPLVPSNFIPQSSFAKKVNWKHETLGINTCSFATVDRNCLWCRDRSSNCGQRGPEFKHIWGLFSFNFVISAFHQNWKQETLNSCQGVGLKNTI